MSFLERYTNGEYQQVWDELVQLGSAVREEPLASDARAVARETMNRVRQNISALIRRLLQLGFSFGYDRRTHIVLSSANEKAKYQAYLEMLHWIRNRPPVFLDARLGGQVLYTIDDKEHTVPNVPVILEKLEKEIGPIPLSVHAWYTEVGAVNFYGYFAPWEQFLSEIHPDLYRNMVPFDTYLMSFCDPFQIRLLDEQFVEHVQERRQTRDQKLFEFEYADDQFFKDYSGGSQTNYSFTFPDAAADTYAYGMTFVQYLRLSLLEYAGFPGMSEWPVKPLDDLATLTHGLLPF
jgi:hypothetical protein